MRIVQVVTRPQRRGAELFAFQLSAALRRQGAEVRTLYLYREAPEPALGYLHANCGHCHSPSGGAWPDSGMVLRLAVDEQDAASTQIVQTTVDQPLEQWVGRGFDYRIVAGDPAQSALAYRMGQRGSPAQMPPLASEHADADGQALVNQWIESLSP